MSFHPGDSQALEGAGLLLSHQSTPFVSGLELSPFQLQYDSFGGEEPGFDNVGASLWGSGSSSSGEEYLAQNLVSHDLTDPSLLSAFLDDCVANQASQIPDMTTTSQGTL